MSTHVIARSAISAGIAGVIAAVIYEVIYFLTSNYHVREGLSTAAIIGAVTFLIAFGVGLVFRQVFQQRS